jgi:hypothetical protein
MLLLVLQQPVGPGQPAAGLRELSPVDQAEGQPERAPCGPPEVAALGVELLGALQRPQAVSTRPRRYAAVASSSRSSPAKEDDRSARDNAV